MGLSPTQIAAATGLTIDEIADLSWYSPFTNCGIPECTPYKCSYCGVNF